MVAVLAHLLLKLDMRITKHSQVYHLDAKDIPPCQGYVAGILSHGGQGHHPCHHSNCFCGGWFLARGAQSNQVVAVALSLVGLRLCLLGGSTFPIIGNSTSTPMSLMLHGRKHKHPSDVEQGHSYFHFPDPCILHLGT